jgi:hypothetical protein
MVAITVGAVMVMPIGKRQGDVGAGEIGENGAAR